MNKYIFYKGVLKSELIHPYIPGSVTTNFNEALKWKERISSTKNKGAAKHVNHGKAVVIQIKYTGELKDHYEFQRHGVSEHNRINCWMSQAKDKAQINTICDYKILTIKEEITLFKY